MPLPETIEPLLAPLEALQRLLERFNEQGTIIGGVAVGFLGQARLTADADAMILLSLDELPNLLLQAKKEGLVPRINNVEEFARRSRVVLLRHAESGIDVDISLGMLPFEVEMVERSQVYQAGALQIRLPSPEDLIVMKAIAHRPKDMLDIEAIIANQPKLDSKRIQFWVEQFAEILETPELWTDVARLLRKAK